MTFLSDPYCAPRAGVKVPARVLKEPLAQLDVLGIDPSLSATGFAHISVRLVENRARVTLKNHHVHTCLSSDRPIGERLETLRDSTIAQVTQAAGSRRLKLVVGVEDYSRGSRFRREEAGMTGGCVRAALWSGEYGDDFIVPIEVPPRDAKRVACPDWPGWSKAHWRAAGYTAKYKMSMPDKPAVISGLYRRWKIKTLDDAVADACCIAIYAASRVLKFNPEV